MGKIRTIFKKYQEQISYLFFGGCTTLVSIVSYYICAHPLGLNINLSTALSNIIAIIFAYITNRLWVFKDKATTKAGIIREILSFLAARAATFVLDMLIMFVFADKLQLPDMPVKVISTIIVIILNYVASKLFVFKKEQSKKD